MYILRNLISSNGPGCKVRAAIITINAVSFESVHGTHDMQLYCVRICHLSNRTTNSGCDVCGA